MTTATTVKTPIVATAQTQAVAAQAVAAQAVAAQAVAAQAAAAQAVAAQAAAAPLDLTSVTLTRSQKKAIGYAKGLHAIGELDTLALSTNKTDKALHSAIIEQSAYQRAMGNNNLTYRFILARIGSDNFQTPDNAKVASLLSWVAHCDAKVRGSDESTTEQRTKRNERMQTRFGSCFALVEALRTVKAIA
jgi:hypothetical protein